jgi:hypothetical protein
MSALTDWIDIEACHSSRCASIRTRTLEEIIEQGNYISPCDCGTEGARSLARTELSTLRARVQELEAACKAKDEALAGAIVLTGICSDWNLPFVEVEVPSEFVKDDDDRDGSMVSIHCVKAWFKAALLRARGGA